MKAKLFFTSLMMLTLPLYGQTLNDNITLTSREIGMASISKDVHSALINGLTYYYSVIESKPDYAVIVAKKKAYKDFTEVVLPETFTSADGKTLTIVGIGDKAFEKCRSIKKVDLPKTVRVIGEEAFCNTDVDDLSLKEGLIFIGNRAFFNNDIKNIHIPDGVQEIGVDHAFAMTRNGYGAWFNSRRKILCLPDHVNLDNCKKMGISREPVEHYLKK